MTDLTAIRQLLPEPVSAALGQLDAEAVEELRLRAGQAPGVTIRGEERLLCPGPVSAQQLRELVSRASGYSAYAVEDSLRQGFLTLPGGHRLGICGTAVMTEGRVKTLKDISSVNLRVARAVPGAAEPLLGLLQRQPQSLLLLGPPGSGKTTLLRDLLRLLSDALGRRVAVADERGELAAALHGTPQLDVGRRTDVLSLCPKARAAELLTRTMNPEYLAMDEITAPQDVTALGQAAYCGVHLLATAHGSGPEDLANRPLYRQLMELGIFRRVAVLAADKSCRVVEWQP